MSMDSIIEVFYYLNKMLNSYQTHCG